MSEKFVFLLVFSGVGVVLLLIALIALGRQRRFVAESLRAEGRVVRLAERRDSDGTTYSPVVRFAPPGAREIEFTDPVWSSPAGYRVGQQVEVFYHYQEHRRARLASPFRLYFVPGLLGFIGFVFASAGALVFFLS